MKAGRKNTVVQRSIVRLVLGTGAILLVPLAAMQFTDEVRWTPSDFIIMGALIFITGLSLDFVMRKADKYRLALATVIIVLFLWVWAELAVGIFTNLGS